MSLTGWAQYLHDCNVTVNPFDRSQWNINRAEFLQLAALSDIGVEMQFNLSDEIRSRLSRSSMKSDRFSSSKDQIRVSVVSSIPGGGKTRLLLELLELRQDFEALYFVTFNNASPLSQYDEMQDDQLAERSVAMRILFQAVAIVAFQKGRQLQTFDIWVKEIHDKGLEDVMTIKNAIALLGGDVSKRCGLAVDECNKLEEEVNVWHRGEIAPGVAMSNLVKVLGRVMILTRISSYMAGTLISGFADAAVKSGFQINTIHLHLLSYAQQCAILDNITHTVGWRCSAKARELLSILGGLPRLIEIFIKAIVDVRLKTGHIDESVNWSSVDRIIREDNSAIAFSTNDPAKAQRLVTVIILREAVKPEWNILPDSPETWESLQQTSKIVLLPHPDRLRCFYPTMPLIGFRELIKVAVAGGGDVSRFGKLDRLMEIDTSTWEGFELFGIKHTAVMNSFFKKAMAETPWETLPLSRRYARGYGGAGDIKIRLLAENPSMIKCRQQFPKTPTVTSRKDLQKFDFTDGNCYHNAKDAEFANGFYVCCEDVDDADTFEDEVMDDAAMGNEDNPALSHTYETPKLVIAEQYKRLETKTLSFEACIKERNENAKAWEDAEGIQRKTNCRLITVIITDCLVPTPENKTQYEDLLVVDITMFKDLYGILEPLLKFTNRLAINTTDGKMMARYFGEDGANRIIQARGLGFKNRQGFDQRMSQAGESVEHWKEILDDCEF